MSPRFLALALASGAVGLPLGCNAITGASDLVVTGSTSGSTGHSHGHSSSHSASSSGAGGSGGFGGAGGATSSSSAGGAGGSGGAGGATASSSSAGTGGAASSSSSSSGTGGAPPTCSPACVANQYCDPGTLTCLCEPGFMTMGTGCIPAPPGDPTMHTQADVCSRWKSAHVLTTPDVLMASGADCDPGYLAPGAIVDVLSRLNMFRWLNGLGPTSDDPQLDAAAQKCADLEAFWPFMGGDPHSPPSTSKCWSSDGATAAQTSNVAWGSGNPAQSIDQWMQDTDNDSNLGHRRWIVNPPLGPVGIGYWKTGGVYGDAACMQVFGTSNTGPNPSWTAVPNAGFVPIEITAWTWSFHGSLGGIATATVSVLRVDDSTNLPVTVTPLDMGYGQEAVGFKPQGWTAEAGKTYRVTVTGPPSGPVTYDVKPVTCN